MNRRRKFASLRDSDLPSMDWFSSTRETVKELSIHVSTAPVGILKKM